MNEIQFETILTEKRKQTEYLRQIRNWVTALGVFFVLVPIIGAILYITVIAAALS
jgi:hypothetical protein